MITLILLASLFCLFLTFIFKTYQNHNRKYGHIPAVSKRLPFLGNLFDLSKTHIVLTEWAKTYGSVFRYSLYGEEIVVLSDYSSINEALVVNGSDVAGRPRMKRTDYNNRCDHSIVWQTYTPKLQFLRKQIHSSLRMYGGGLDRLQDRCCAEIHDLVDRIKTFDGESFDSWNLLYDSACNIMLDLALGKRLQYDGSEFARLKEVNCLFNHTFGPGQSRVLDGLPWLDVLHNESKTLKKALKLRDTFWADHAYQNTGNKESVIADLRKISENPRYQEYKMTEVTMKETFTNLILAGTDTTTTALTCFLLILLHHGDVQQKLQQEIDHVIGRSRDPTLEDRVKMPYLEACILETLRLISHVPLAVPHATVRDTKVVGMTLPKDTTIYINLWALHHDEAFWDSPWSFKPDRFLTSEGSLVPAHHECRKRLMAFGAGRRVCLGEALAKNRLFLFSASLLQNFTFVRDQKHLPSYDPRNYTLGIVLHPGTFRLRAINRNGALEQS